MKSQQVGVIGVGWMGQQHISTMRSHQTAEVVAICDTDDSILQELSKREGVRSYTDWRRMLELETLDAVFVCTPPAQHRDPTVAAFEAGTHVFLEKPIALNLDDAEAIVDAARISGSVCAVGYQWRGVEALEEVSARLDSAEIGLLVGVSLGPTKPRHWFLRQAESGGNLLERGSHHVDLQRLIGGSVVRVQGAEGGVPLAQAASSHSGDIADVVSVILQFDTGALGVVHVAWTPGDLPDRHSLTLVSTETFLELQLYPELKLEGHSQGEVITAINTDDPYDRTVDRFLYAAREGKPELVYCGPEDALGTLRVCMAAQEAIRTERAVRVGES